MGVRLSQVCLVCALVAGGCSAGSSGSVTTADRVEGTTAATPGAPASPVPPAAALPTRPMSPPPVHARGGGRDLELRPSSFCWSGDTQGTCADGTPSESPPDIGSPGEVEIAFDAPGWRFTATVVRVGEPCGRAQTVALAATGPTTHRLRPVGAAGDYVVSLFGRSSATAANRGDLSTSFRWHTPVAGPDVAPSAMASIVAGSPEQPRSFGVELSVQNLRRVPAPGQITASVVVSAGVASVAIPLEREDVACTPEGSVRFTAADEQGLRAASLGPAPFRYAVTLVIQSTTYRGTGTWPDDVDPDCSPCTRLVFDPPLPGL